jgi:hypothetical protein
MDVLMVYVVCNRGIRSVSRPEAGRGLSRELHLLDAEESTVFVKGVVYKGQVQEGRTLTHSPELVVD